MTQSPLGKPYKETIYNENEKRFYRCFIVPKENIELKEVSDLLCEIQNFKKTIQPDYHTIWYLFEITSEEYKQRKLDINKEALELLQSKNKDEDIVICDGLTDAMIDRFLYDNDVKG